MANGGSIDFQLGKLTTAVKDMDARLVKLEKKVDDMNVWRWKVIGAVSILALGGNTLFEVLRTNVI